MDSTHNYQSDAVNEAYRYARGSEHECYYYPPSPTDDLRFKFPNPMVPGGDMLIAGGVMGVFALGCMALMCVANK